MNRAINFELLQQFCQQLLGEHPAIALTTHDGLALKICYQNLPEIGTLPVAAQITHQYLKLSAGDVALTNDPYSGGTILSTMNLVIAITTEGQKEPNLLIVKKVPMKPKIYLGNNIEEEGVRIPPTPILANEKINNSIISAIAEHPLAPQNFENSIKSGVEQMQELHNRFKKLDQIYKIDWSRSKIKSFLKDSQQQMQEILSDIRTGEHIAELELNDGSRLKLRVDVNDEKVTFDFSGSDISDSIHLTDSAALGACTGALVALFGRKLPINNGIFQCIDVVAPEGSMVHAKYPAPVYFGMTDGASMIANLALKAIGNIDKNKRYPLSGSSICSFEIDFNGNHFFETLETGAGASPTKEGADGVNMWRRSGLQPSIEAIEKRYPLLVESFSYRPNSGGSGRLPGGKGIVKSFILQDQAKLSWAITEPAEKPMGAGGGKDAQSAEISIQRVGKEKQLLAKKGKIDLKAGDKVIVNSSGGGGYGEI